jgi:hypothetical protein
MGRRYIQVTKKGDSGSQTYKEVQSQYKRYEKYKLS